MSSAAAPGIVWRQSSKSSHVTARRRARCARRARKRFCLILSGEVTGGASGATGVCSLESVYRANLACLSLYSVMKGLVRVRADETGGWVAATLVLDHGVLVATPRRDTAGSTDAEPETSGSGGDLFRAALTDVQRLCRVSLPDAGFAVLLELVQGPSRVLAVDSEAELSEWQVALLAGLNEVCFLCACLGRICGEMKRKQTPRARTRSKLVAWTDVLTRKRAFACFFFFALRRR